MFQCNVAVFFPVSYLAFVHAGCADTSLSLPPTHRMRVVNLRCECIFFAITCSQLFKMNVWNFIFNCDRKFFVMSKKFSLKI